ncbi:hypothetical protein GTO27_09395 [Candidatus Bathyarchaeota archaeon]|nr:hypothetical protein [Candidatus Bathyarchaeota archaeon]
MDSTYDDMTNSERKVASYLDELSLRYVFQAPIFLLDLVDRPRIWTPDFYIPRLGVYIEVCGSEDFGERGYKFRDKVYRKNEIPIVFVHTYKDSKDWKSWLRNRIIGIHHKRESDLRKLFKVDQEHHRYADSNDDF